MTLHVLFTKDGIPGWIGDQPREGSEPVDGLGIEFMAGHRRTEKGEWVKRDPVIVPPPTPEEIAAAIARDEAERREAEAQAQEDREFRLMKRMLRLMHRRLRGEITQAQYIAQTDAIIAAFQG